MEVKEEEKGERGAEKLEEAEMAGELEEEKLTGRELIECGERVGEEDGGEQEEKGGPNAEDGTQTETERLKGRESDE